MSNESENRGPLNPYGDLSRRAMRELEAKGINPADAVAAFNETGDIQALTGSIPIIPPATVPVVAVPVATEPVAPPVTAPAAPPIVAPVAVAPTPVFPSVAPPAPPVPPVVAPPVVATPVVVAPVVAAPAPLLPPVAPVVAQSIFPETISGRDERILEERRTAEIPVVDPKSIDGIDANSEDADDEAIEIADPVVVTTEIESVEDEPVIIDVRDDHSEITNEFEPFTISTTSTGVVPIAGHALILPTLPEDNPDVIAQLNQTGEIVITGQITLPMGIASVGADTNSLDTMDVDLSPDSDIVTSSQDLAPVSASQAVSSFSGTTVTVTAPRRSSEKMPVVLAITAAALAVGVVGLFVANFFLHVF